MKGHRGAFLALVVTGVLGLTVWLGQAPVGAQEAGAHAFTGAAQCGRCHRADRTGNQLARWQESAHARAFQTLASPEAQALAAERGIANPQEADECVRCHVTAHGVDASLLGEDFDRTQGVQCESCHGPGADYSPARVMRDREAAVAAGLVMPDEAVCVGCHNDQSPSFQGFNFAEAAATIAHPNPASE